MLTTTDLTPSIGSEVRADRKALLDGSLAQELRRRLEARSVLVFRDLELDPEEHVALGRTLGAIAPQAGEDIFKIALDANDTASPRLAEYLKGTFYWHMDGSHEDVPHLFSLLRPKRIADEGGDTDYASTYAAYEALPDEEKTAFEKLRVVHSIEAAQRYYAPEPSYEELMGWRSYPRKSHPLVWTRRSGRKSLVLGSSAAYVEGMSYEDGQALLCRLRDWATQPRFVYRHKWRMGDLVVWDNTGTMHRATPYRADSGRLMTRVTVVGEEPLM